MLTEAYQNEDEAKEDDGFGEALAENDATEEEDDEKSEEAHEEEENKNVCIQGFEWSKKDGWGIRSHNVERIDGLANDQACLTKCLEKDWCKSIDWYQNKECYL